MRRANLLNLLALVGEAAADPATPPPMKRSPACPTELVGAPESVPST